MNSKIFVSLVKWFGISVGVGMLFNILWAVVFWNNDGLFMYHWLGVPIGMILMAFTGFISLFYRKQD